MTPRQAAYRELCSIVSQLSGRSRRAQRALLEAELARALERAYEFRLRSEHLDTMAAEQSEKLIRANIEVVLAKAAARQRIQEMRRELFVVVERCRGFERVCRDALVMTDDSVAVEPPPLVVRPPRPEGQADPDAEVDTQRNPPTSAAFPKQP